MPTTCAECGQSFSRSQAMEFHRRAKHGRRLPCSVCGKEFHENGLRVHVATKHGVGREKEAPSTPGTEEAPPESPAGATTSTTVTGAIGVAPPPPGSEPLAGETPAQPIIITDEAIRFLLNAPFDALAFVTKFEGYKLDLNAKESAEITPLARRVAEKRLPEWLKKYGDEFALGLALGIPLLAKTKAYAEWREQQEAKKKSGGGNRVGGGNVAAGAELDAGAHAGGGQTGGTSQ